MTHSASLVMHSPFWPSGHVHPWLTRLVPPGGRHHLWLKTLCTWAKSSSSRCVTSVTRYASAKETFRNSEGNTEGRAGRAISCSEDSRYQRRFNIFQARASRTTARVEPTISIIDEKEFFREARRPLSPLSRMLVPSPTTQATRRGDGVLLCVFDLPVAAQDLARDTTAAR